MTMAARDTPLKVGLIGFGAIGRSVAALLPASVALGVLTRSAPADLPVAAEALADADALLAWGPDVVIEAASAEAFAQTAPACLGQGIDVVAASVGALQDSALLDRILAICSETGSRLVVPAGAVGGLDHIAAAALHPETIVTYVSRKPPAAWSAELEAMGQTEAASRGEVSLYEGNAREAAARYPRNLNAGLTIALAAGFDRVRVRVVADPEVARNTHEIVVSGPLGTSTMSFCNMPDPSNPKTSAITAYSLVAATLRRFEALQ